MPTTIKIFHEDEPFNPAPRDKHSPGGLNLKGLCTKNSQKILQLSGKIERDRASQSSRTDDVKLLVLGKIFNLHKEYDTPNLIIKIHKWTHEQPYTNVTHSTVSLTAYRELEPDETHTIHKGYTSKDVDAWAMETPNNN